MAQTPRREIQKALLAEIGSVTAQTLISASRPRWELWRRMITDARKEDPSRILARCGECFSPVYIRTAMLGGIKRPLFAHFKGGDETCPWFTGKTMTPDAARASQYRGQQESETHRLMCDLIAELAVADPRTVEVKVDSYLSPTANDHGRYPDVFVHWMGMAPMAIELQLSRTFQTEIAERSRHYAREGLPLIWVLEGVDLDGEIPQAFRDVLSRHRLNAFFIDEAAVTASREQKTLVLSCRLAGPNGAFGPPSLVRLDALHFPPGGSPYREDRLSPILLAKADQLRAPWKSALQAHVTKTPGGYLDVRLPIWRAAFEALYLAMPTLRTWSRNPGTESQFAELVATLVSLVTHANGKFRNYVTREANIQGLLNSRLQSNGLGPYVPILETAIERSAAFDLLDGSVGVHIRRAYERWDGNLCLDFEPEWQALAELLPELFDGRLRAELAAVGAIPTWVRAPYPSTEDQDQAA